MSGMYASCLLVGFYCVLMRWGLSHLDDGSFVVTVTVFNDGDATETLSTVASALLGGKWGSPDWITVTDTITHSKLAYHGPTAKIADHKASRNAILEAGQSVSGALDLSDVYELRSGVDYVVEISQEITHGQSVPHTVAYTRPSSGPKWRARVQHSMDTRCSDVQSAIINESIVNARSMLDRCYTEYFFNRSCSNGAHYRRFFGQPALIRFVLVQSVLQEAQLLLSDTNASLPHFTCNNCDEVPESAVAWVTQGDENRVINMCFEHPLYTDPDRINIGVDSIPGIMIHEASHFFYSVVDHAYGLANSEAIASTVLSVQNADSYEYFCETYPSTLTTDHCDSCGTVGVIDNATECLERMHCGLCNRTDGEFVCVGATNELDDGLNFPLADANQCEENVTFLAAPGDADGFVSETDSDASDTDSRVPVYETILWILVPVLLVAIIALFWRKPRS